jgi:NAD(P)-dependent dehydrogenase (short-subunit alcohol dehydrogenase family)
MPATALITGASKGIGEAIGRAYARRGLSVALAARTEADVCRVADSICEEGGRAIGVTCDVTAPDSVAASVEKVRAELGPVTVLVNNAGLGGSHKFLGHDDALWHRLVDVNLNSVYYVSKQVVPDMIAAQWGRIVNLGSIASKVGSKYMAAYTASKHGVLGLTRALAVELLPYNITVNCICPGYVDTPMTDGTVENIVSRTGMSAEEARKTIEGFSPQNRLISPVEVALVAVMLIDENAKGITGQAINVDGGVVMF